MEVPPLATSSHAGAYFGDDFGQKIDLTVRIREILRNYPEGTSIFKEMVQNADDAGATEVNFCIDYRRHGADKLAYTKLEPFQGPSLIVHNNATFTDADFESIQRIGDSLKKDNSKGWKTGRFGVGFNSVYHVTDLPAFVSGSHLVFFDPQACHLPNVNPSNPGKMINFLTHPELVADFPDQVAPFRCFGCDFAGPFPGTLFRLALRTERQAQSSKLSSRTQRPEHVAEMLRDFADDLSRVMLFLRNITKISIFEWRADSDAPNLLHEAAISNLTSEVQAKRSLKFASFESENAQSRQFSSDGIPCDYILAIKIYRCTDDATETLRFLVLNQLGGGECARIANDPANASQRLVPWGGVAVLLPSHDDPSSFRPLAGMAFCFLPLPTLTYLPIHVNGYFELSSNRRDIWFGDGLSGEGLLRAQWNLALLSDVIAPCYARAVTSLAADGKVAPEQHVRLFPQVQPPAPWDTLARSFFTRIRAKPCLYTEADGGSWIAPASSVLVRRDAVDYSRFVSWLLDDSFPVVRNLSEELEKFLVATHTVPSFLEPSVVRKVYASRRSRHGGNNGAVRCLLEFMLSDLDAARLHALIGVTFLPVADGTLVPFASLSSVDPTALEYLCSMGFSRQHSIRALEEVGGRDMEAGLNWLFQNPNPSKLTTPRSGASSSRTYLIPNAEELALLQSARSSLVEIDALSPSSMALLSSEAAKQQLNVKKMDFQGFEDMLAIVLPSDWYSKASVAWDHESEDEPNAAWFRLLWKYIGASAHVSSFQDKWPIVPTSTGVLATLSKASGVLTPELIPPGCLHCLEQLDVRLLLPNLFASFNPHPSVWQYIHQPTPAGVLSCIGAIAASSSPAATPASMKRVFRNASVADRDHLRAFLLSAQSEELDATQRRVCQQLPIFHGFQRVEDVADDDVSWVERDASEDSDVAGGDRAHELTSSTITPVFAPLVRSHRDDEPSVFMCVGMAWKFLDDDFVFVKEGDTAMWKFLVRMGVRAVSRVDFFVNHLIPRFQALPHEARIEFIYQLLLEMTTLLAQDTHGKLSSIIEVAPIFPTASGEVKAISDLYDPEVDDFTELMDDAFFPAIELQDAQPLSVLRSLGLQRTISRRSILSLALSIENEQIKLTTLRASEGESRDVEAKRVQLETRAGAFFKYLDTHMEQLTSVEAAQKQKRAKTTTANMKMKGLRFLRSFGLPAQTDAAEDASVSEAERIERLMHERREIEEFAAQLAVIEWVPVSHAKPHPACPMYLEDKRVVVTSPKRARPAKDIWLCSAQCHIIHGAIYSERMIAAFGWDACVPVETVALQLKCISDNFGAYAAEQQGHVDTQAIGSAVYSIYRILSSFFESERDAEQCQRVLAVLSGDSKYVWVGSHFVSTSQVAMSAYVNAEPYLYTIPSEQLHFRPLWKALGVQERFLLVDYIHVISSMHTKCQQPLAPQDVPESALPLASDELVTAIGLLQLISDMLSHHSDYELYAPDTTGVLVPTATLTFDDTPWLDASGRGDTVRRLRFVHPKISNEVAHKLGCKSLRGHLLHANHADSSLFSIDNSVEHFGQTEALTKRISHILEQYPDGPNIISELIQNADDAGATRVALLYNGVTYGMASLLSPNMAKWQGPALYCYNDAEFSDHDFVNLARIGQAKKLQRATTTGRFGLGFNSVYHFTDLPAIVSAKSIVIFDPHTSHLPGISAANPGIKVRFADSDLPEQFPDQFAPFSGVFGCDLRRHYNGTLFRFPLRTPALAEASEIKRRAYAQSDILDLFRMFKGTIASTMLFLRNVRKVDVFVQTAIDAPPVLLYGAEVPAEDRGESWRQIDKFMASSDEPRASSAAAVGGVTSKRQFYAQLRRTPESELPSVTQVVHIRSYEHETYDACMDAIEAAGASAHVMPSACEKTLGVEKYLVCNQLGGGRARELACAAGNESLKLIPWAGIAGRISDTPIEGRAFCFLPLPVKIGLPVHINGYFELSSNRRDIWHGDDMAGDGKLRSDWNASLLSDAVAPAYLSFLLEARRVCGDDMAQYFSFFPSRLPSGPWATVVRSLFQRMEHTALFAASPVLLATDGAAERRRFVAPKSCVIVDEAIVGYELLERALAAVAVDTVYAPAPLRELLVQLNAVFGSMTPAFFCRLVRRGDFLPRLPSELVERVVEFCTSGASSSSLELLHDLPLLPLRSGAFGRFQCERDGSPATPVFYFGSAIEEELLEMFPNALVLRAFKQYFDALPSVYTTSNVRKLSIRTVAREFFPKLFAGCWQRTQFHHYDVCALEPSSSSLALSSRRAGHDWLRKWWKYVDASLQAGDDWSAEMTQDWPTIPVRVSAAADDDGVKWLSLASKPCLLVEPTGPSLHAADMSAKLAELLCKIGVYVIDASVVSGDRSTEWLVRTHLAFKLDSDGLLLALSQAQQQQPGGLFEHAFAAITAAERQTLGEFFAANGVNAISDSCLPILRDLPIFAVHAGSAYRRAADDDAALAADSSEHDHHTSLRQRRLVPAADADTRVLDEAYFVVATDAMRKFLCDLDLEEWTYTATLMRHVLPRLQSIEANDPSLVDAVVGDALRSLPFHQRKDSAFSACVQSLPVIPSRKRVLRRVSELHDPTSRELSELVGSTSLPSDAFSTPEIVEILRSLGLRTSLSCHAILESARSIEVLYESDEREAIELAWSKAVSLVKLVNKHFDEMATAPDGALADGVDDILDALRSVVWLPVHTAPPESGMPWEPRADRSSSRAAHARRLSSAIATRPEKDAWLCSSSSDILAEPLLSDVLLTAFGWKLDVEPVVLAAQVEAIGVACERRSAMASSPTVLKHTVLKMQQLYMLLDEARERAAARDHDESKADDDCDRSDDDDTAAAPRSFDAVYAKLADAPWIWTGKVFARPSHIAFEADAGLEPLLFAAPPESVLSRAFLDKFGIKQSFSVEDFLDVLAHLPRSARLSEAQVKACLRIFALAGADMDRLRDATARLPPQMRVLLSASNRLEVAARLVYDDMVWNESHVARQGCDFVHRSVEQAVAFTLGATSLHTKHAESTGSSTKIACPTVAALCNVLPDSANVWVATFFSEILLAAERYGSSQVDVFVDYRQHPSERVILPTLQSLQHAAVCIHIHGVKLSAAEVNRLFGGEHSRAGVLSGFFISDCMQILSGNSFYVLDPSGAYLSTASPSSSSSATARAAGRQYDILDESFLSYPDQLLPFCSLPSCPGNVTKGTQSTLIRFPWRTASSEVSTFVPSAKVISRLVGAIKQQAVDALVFTESVAHVSVWSIGKNSEYETHCHADAKLATPRETLKRRNATRASTEWQKKFLLQSFFKSPVVPENQVEFDIELELENRLHRDTWLLCDNIGAGRSRDLACSPVHEALASTPYVSVACHLYRDNNAPNRMLRGRLYKIVDTGQRTGLPVHINGCFKKAIRETGLLVSAPFTSGSGFSSGTVNGSESQVKATWNRTLLEDGVVDAYMKLLLLAKRRYESTHSKALYSIWPRLLVSRANLEVGTLVQERVYQTIGSHELFLCTDGSYRTLNSGYVINLVDMDIQVASFAQLHFPAFSVPQAILSDCTRLLPSRVQSLTPRTMRRFLRRMRASDIHASVCLPLLEYCLSDLQLPLPSETSAIWSEFNALPILPLEDGSTGVIRLNQRSGYVLGTFNQVQLLAPRASMFVSLEARQRLHTYFSDSRFVSVMGLSFFSIKTLSDHIDHVLPARWKHQDVVAWDPASPDAIDELWLHRFWQEVRFERRSLGYFSAWPLIPVQGSRLVTCGKPDAALCVWRESGTASVLESVLREFKQSAEAHEQKLAERESERRELMELSKNKLLRDDLVDGASDSDDASETHDEDDSASDVSSVADADDASERTAASADDRSEQLPDSHATELLTSDADASASTEDYDDASAMDERALMSAEDAVDRASEHATAVVIDMIEEVVQETEYCSRETLHTVLTRRNAAMIELAFFSGHESELVPSSRAVAISVLDCLATARWSGIDWHSMTVADATFLAEFFSFHSSNYGGFNRMHMDMLKRVPMFVNICDVACAIDTGDFYLVPPEIDLATVPLPPNARESFLKVNPRLTGFYRDLGVQEMSNAKLLIFLLPTYAQLGADQRDTILSMIKQHWQTLRGDSDLTRMLKATALFRDVDGAYQPASAFYDPRNKVLATIYRDAPEQFPVAAYQSPAWLDLMGEIGLHSEITVEIFISCARRIEALFANKTALLVDDETLVLALHQYFIQNFERFDRSRNFFETIATIAFVPAVSYERTTPTGGASAAGSFASRTTVVRYVDCAMPDDQALVFTSKPILLASAVPPRILWSRLNIVSPPPKDVVLAHLFSITGESASDRSPTLQWQFYLPAVEVFQELFKYLQTSWDSLHSDEQRRIANAAIVPIGSSLVKGARLYFHLGENLAPLMYEVPRAFGAYDTLFRRLGSKASPDVDDYVALLEDLHAECNGHALNLNELVAVTRIVNLLADTLADTSQTLSVSAKKRVHLPSSASVMEPLVQMAYNDSPWLCARIDLSDLHVVHPRISTRWCQALGVPGISAVVAEELATDDVDVLPPCAALAHVNAVLASPQFANGVRKIITVQQQKATLSEPFGFIPDFDAINERIVALATFDVQYVDTLTSRFVATLGHPLRRVDVTKSSASMTSLSFVDATAHVIYVAKRTLETHGGGGLRVAQVVASCINQLVGGVLHECASVESILSCDVTEIDALLDLLHVCEDTELIVEKLRGVLGEPLTALDRAAIELAPLHAHLAGELVAVEVDGHLRYGKIVQAHEPQDRSDASVRSYEVKVAKTQTKWYPSSQIYTFRSVRRSVSSDTNNASADAAIAERLVAQTVESAPSESLPASLTARSDLAHAPPSSRAAIVPAATVVSAVNDMLARFNVSLSTEYEDLLEENLRLRQRLEQAEEGRRVAAAQIDDAIREKKDAQDSLICAICLENKVDRVLIPCGHIYCHACVERLPRPSCPICRQHIASSSTFHVPS